MSILTSGNVLINGKAYKFYPPKRANEIDLPLESVNAVLEALIPLTWRDKLVTASFRGIPFCVKKTSTSGGRRTKVAYQFPGKYKRTAEQQKGYDAVNKAANAIAKGGSASSKSSNLKYAKGANTGMEYGYPDIMDIYPYVYDTGMEVLEYKIEGYLIANDFNDYNYLDHRKYLMRAFQQEGVGILMHPSLGVLNNVYVKGAVNFDEDFEAEGGLCRFTAVFLRGREFILQNDVYGQKDLIQQVKTSALDGWLMALDKFAENINRLGTFAGSIITAMSNFINKIASTVTNIAGAMSSVVTSITTALHTLAASLNTLFDTPCALAAAYKTAADAISGVAGLIDELDFGGVTGKCSGKRRGDTVKLNGTSVPESLGVSIANEAKKTADSITEKELGGTDYMANTDEQSENMTLIVNTALAALISTTLPVVMMIDFSSQQKADEILVKMTDMLNSYLLRLGNTSGAENEIDYSDLYTYYDNLKNIFITNMQIKNASLVKEVDYLVPPDVYSSMVLAYDMYYDLDRSWEAEQRNEPLARHPGFLPSGQNIKILEA
jgi:prophage DNA circulation protein